MAKVKSKVFDEATPVEKVDSLPFTDDWEGRRLSKDVVGDNEKIPVFGSRGWNLWVMSKLHDDEVFEGHPTVVGLRRFTSEHFGVVLESTTKCVMVPQLDNDRQAAAEHTLVVEPFANILSSIGSIRPIALKMTGLADACEYNAGKIGLEYPTAMAETRAEGRAYVRLLRLSTCTRDEMNRGAASSQPASPNEESTDFMTEALAVLIDSISRRLNINVLNYFAKSGTVYKAGQRIPLVLAVEVRKQLAELQRKRNNKELSESEAALIESVSGYTPDWRG